MLQLLRYEKPFRCFKKGDTIVFEPGVNLLVGDQGCGKSSLLLSIDRLRQGSTDIAILATEGTQCTYHDFERDNPRTASGFNPDGFDWQVQSLFSSHGQSVNVMLRSLTAAKQKLTMLLDEPDMALSVRSVRNLVTIFRELAAAGHQVIAAVHNPFLLWSFNRVYSLEHRQWMGSVAFINGHWPIKELVASMGGDNRPT